MACGDVCVAYGSVPNSQLEHSVEHHSPAAGVAPVEAEHEFVEVIVQMGVLDRALVSAENPPLGQRGDSMHGGQQLPSQLIPSEPSRALAARLAGVAALVQPPVALPAVRDDGSAWLDVIADEGVQGCGRGVSQRCNPTPPVAAGLLDLHRDARQHLVAPAFAAAYSRISTANVGLVDLHSADQALAPRAHEHGPQPVKHGPYGLVGTDLESALQTQRCDSVLASGEEPAGGEPQGQGRTVER
jgi:hypothetical protein